MSFNRRMALAALASLPLAACNTVKPHRNVYDGLLPAGVLPRDAAQPLNRTELKGKSVAVVLSANFEDYVATWVAHYERGGAEDRKAMIASIGQALGLAGPLAAVGAGLGGSGSLLDSAIQSTRQASDPRRVIDHLHGQLRNYFGKVTVATDLADARAQKADFIALADLHFTANPMGNAFLFKGGVQLLDHSIRKHFGIDADVSAPRPMTDVSGARALNQGLGEVSRRIAQGLAQHLAP